MNALASQATVEQLLKATKLFGLADVGWRGTLHFQLPLELAFVEATVGEAEPAKPDATRPPAAKPEALKAAIKPRDVAPKLETAPISEQEPLVAGATGEVSGELRERWAEVKRAVRAVNRQLEGFLNDVRPLGTEADRALLEARFPFHRDKVMEVRNREQLEQQIEKALGRAFRVECAVAATWPADGEESLDPRDTPAVRAAIERGWQAKVVTDGPETGT